MSLTCRETEISDSAAADRVDNSVLGTIQSFGVSLEYVCRLQRQSSLMVSICVKVGRQASLVLQLSIEALVE